MTRIICSAIWFKDNKKHCHQPRNIDSGFVVCGLRHHNCFNTVGVVLSLSGNENILREDKIKTVQGFLSSNNEFVTREEGFIIATEANQIKEDVEIRKSGKLYSEDIF